MIAQVNFYRGVSLISRAIRFCNWGPYSHVSWSTADNTEIEAWKSGVIEIPGLGRNHTPGTIVDQFAVEGVEPYNQAEIDAQMRTFVGKKYDYLGIFGFVARAPWLQRKNRLFCSELVFTGLQKAGMEPLKIVPAYKVSPTLLSYSPRLTFVRWTQASGANHG